VVSITHRLRFTPGQRAPGTHCRGDWVGPRAGLDPQARRKILCLCQGLNPGRPVRSQATITTELLGSRNVKCRSSYLRIELGILIACPQGLPEALHEHFGTSKIRHYHFLHIHPIHYSWSSCFMRLYSVQKALLSPDKWTVMPPKADWTVVQYCAEASLIHCNALHCCNR
jgi:hypothetical protein